jgi:hypothetical protein
VGLSLPFAPTTQPATAADVSLQGGDVAGGLSRCSISGSIEKYIAGLQAAGSPGTDVVQSEWARVQRLGATDGYVSSYAKSAGDCSVRLGERTAASAISFTFRFASDSQAAAAHSTGFLDLRPGDDATLPGLVQGRPTGLGADAWTYAQATPAPPIFVAYWAHSNFAVFLMAENLDPTAGERAALNIDSRVR